MAWCIGFILILWLMTKATSKPKKVSYIDTLDDDVIYVTADELDEVLVRLDELEERLKEMQG